MTTRLRVDGVLSQNAADTFRGSPGASHAQRAPAPSRYEAATVATTRCGQGPPRLALHILSTHSSPLQIPPIAAEISAVLRVSTLHQVSPWPVASAQLSPSFSKTNN